MPGLAGLPGPQPAGSGRCRGYEPRPGRGWLDVTGHDRPHQRIGTALHRGHDSRVPLLRGPADRPLRLPAHDGGARRGRLDHRSPSARRTHPHRVDGVRRGRAGRRRRRARIAAGRDRTPPGGRGQGHRRLRPHGRQDRRRGFGAGLPHARRSGTQGRIPRKSRPFCVGCATGGSSSWATAPTPSSRSSPVARTRLRSIRVRVWASCRTRSGRTMRVPSS